MHRNQTWTPHVLDHHVDYDHKTAMVKCNASRTSPSAVVKVATNADFPSALQSGEQK